MFTSKPFCFCLQRNMGNLLGVAGVDIDLEELKQFIPRHTVSICAQIPHRGKLHTFSPSR